jgi:hypothetical protein
MEFYDRGYADDFKAVVPAARGDIGTLVEMDKEEWIDLQKVHRPICVWMSAQANLAWSSFFYLSISWCAKACACDIHVWGEDRLNFCAL